MASNETSAANVPLLAKAEILRKLETVARELHSAAYLLVEDVAEPGSLGAGSSGGCPER